MAMVVVVALYNGLGEAKRSHDVMDAPRCLSLASPAAPLFSSTENKTSFINAKTPNSQRLMSDGADVVFPSEPILLLTANDSYWLSPSTTFTTLPSSTYTSSHPALSVAVDWSQTSSSPATSAWKSGSITIASISSIVRTHTLTWISWSSIFQPGRTAQGILSVIKFRQDEGV